MNDRLIPTLPKWPFFVADLTLAIVAGLIVWLSAHPMEPAPLAMIVFSMALGACLSVTPFLIEYRASEHAFQSEKLKSATDQLDNLELLNVQVGTSLAQLHTVLEECAKLVSSSGSLSDQVAAQAKTFLENVEKAQDADKSNLRLELDKLRRAETDWLQVTTGIMDHIFALNQAAVKSGQPELSRQIGLFQRACRDLARRVGLVPFAPEENQPFDGNVHHLADPDAPAIANAQITRIIATGYTYQGQLIRRALVSVAPQENQQAIPQPTADSALPIDESSQPEPSTDSTAVSQANDHGDSGSPTQESAAAESQSGTSQTSLPL